MKMSVTSVIIFVVAFIEINKINTLVKCLPTNFSLDLCLHISLIKFIIITCTPSEIIFCRRLSRRFLEFVTFFCPAITPVQSCLDDSRITRRLKINSTCVFFELYNSNIRLIVIYFKTH